MNIKSIKEEITQTRKNGCFRAAFGSIVRRNYDEINQMTGDQKKQFLEQIGANRIGITGYSKELGKELSVERYHRKHGYK